MRVFISSTVFDLIGVRMEIAEHLRVLGITPVLSDDKLSDFKVKHDVNSIETCLANVAACDEVIVVLDQRYGPRLDAVGYDSISATHLEYQKAVEMKLPIRLYVRDRLIADYSIWKRNNRSDSLSLTWVKQRDHGLFEMLDKHCEFHKRDQVSNWYTTFTTSIDLKASLSKYFEKQMLPRRIVQLIQENSFPLIDVTVESELISYRGKSAMKVLASPKNVGGSAAFNCHVYWDEGWDNTADDMTWDILSPGQSLFMSFFYFYTNKNTGLKRFLYVEYESPIGVKIIDQFKINSHILPGGGLSFGSVLDDRKFVRSNNLSIKIDDP